MAVVAVVEDFFDLLVERRVESRDDLVPDKVSAGDLVEILFYVCREVVVHDVGEVLLKVVGHDHADLLREQFPSLGSDAFGSRDILDGSVL